MTAADHTTGTTDTTSVVVVDARLRPGEAARAFDLVGAPVAATREEAGCLQYRLLVDRDDDHHLVLLEEWQDDAALAAHMATPAYARLMQALLPLLGGEGTGLRLRPVA